MFRQNQVCIIIVCLLICFDSGLGDCKTAPKPKGSGRRKRGSHCDDCCDAKNQCTSDLTYNDCFYLKKWSKDIQLGSCSTWRRHLCYREGISALVLLQDFYLAFCDLNSVNESMVWVLGFDKDVLMQRFNNKLSIKKQNCTSYYNIHFVFILNWK